MFTDLAASTISLIVIKALWSMRFSSSVTMKFCMTESFSGLNTDPVSQNPKEKVIHKCSKPFHMTGIYPLVFLRNGYMGLVSDWCCAAANPLDSLRHNDFQDADYAGFSEDNTKSCVGWCENRNLG